MAGPAARDTSWDLGWMEKDSNVWLGTRVFTSRMIKLNIERLPTAYGGEDCGETWGWGQ